MQWLSLILLIPYLYLLLRIFFSLRKTKPYVALKSANVFVSVIVACKNEDKNLSTLLPALAAQDYDPDLFEVLIIDDNSTDLTYSIASGFKGVRNKKVIRNEGTGKKRAIKTGVKACNGELVITTDADCRPGSRWIKTVASFYSAQKPEMIIGPVIINDTRGFINRFQALEFLSLQGVTAGTAMNGSPVMCNGANLAFTKESFLTSYTDLHEEKISGDDVFLLHSLKKKSDKIMWLESPDALVSTTPCDKWSSFFKQRARWISKTGSYRDRYTILLAIVTFVTILLQPFLLVAAIFNPLFLQIFVAAFIIKSIPDYLVLQNTTERYGRSSLMKWFLLSELFYTIYIICIVFAAILRGNRWN